MAYVFSDKFDALRLGMWKVSGQPTTRLASHNFGTAYKGMNHEITNCIMFVGCIEGLKVLLVNQFDIIYEKQ